MSNAFHTRKCVQCGCNFYLSESEINFYTSKNLSLPKRCKACREKNKAEKNHQSSSQHYREFNVISPKAKKITAFLIASILYFTYMFSQSIRISPALWVFICVLLIGLVLLIVNLFFKIRIQEFDTSYFKHTFYDTNSMTKHYIKHGREVSCGSMEEYLRKANLLIENPYAMKKIQKEDGDTAYFYPQTNEFAVVAKAGYIRTYFKADLHYFNKQ